MEIEPPLASIPLNQQQGVALSVAQNVNIEYPILGCCGDDVLRRSRKREYQTVHIVEKDVTRMVFEFDVRSCLLCIHPPLIRLFVSWPVYFVSESV